MSDWSNFEVFVTRVVKQGETFIFFENQLDKQNLNQCKDFENFGTSQELLRI